VALCGCFSPAVWSGLRRCTRGSVLSTLSQVKGSLLQRILSKTSFFGATVVEGTSISAKREGQPILTTFAIF